MANLPKPTSSSLFGQFRDDVLEQVKDTAGDVGKAVVSEPKKILESILGGQPDLPGNEDQGQSLMEQGVSGNDPAQSQQQAQKLQMMRVEDQNKREALLRLHKQRLEEEKTYFQQKQQQEETEEQQKDQEEQQKKQEEIMQIQHERQKSQDIQSAMLGKLEGTKEAGKMQGF
jgi:septin family protein